MNELAYVGCALVLLIYQVYVSVIIFRADEYERVQQLLQLLIIWFVPLFGALGCHLILQSERKPPRHSDKFFVPQEANDAGGSGHDGGEH